MSELKKVGSITEELAGQWPQQALQYGRRAEELMERWKHPKWVQRVGYQKPTVIVLWGDTATGKTRTAMEAGACRRCNGGSWHWNTYRGQEVVLYDEFNGDCIPHDQFMMEIDGYPVEVPIIYLGNKPFIPKTIYICSNEAPERWYARLDSRKEEAMLRRFDEIWHYAEEDGEVVKRRIK